MRIIPTPLKGVVVVEQEVFRDPRGIFLETYHAKKFTECGIQVTFFQDNLSRSHQGTLRGLHGQLRHPQGKLVRAVEGEIFDVAVDARPDSPTFEKWFGQKLGLEDGKQLYIPPGFLHGFCVLSPTAVVEYKCTAYYDRSDEIGVRWDDPEIGIRWPTDAPLLSERDGKLPLFGEMKEQFELYRGL